MTNGLNTSGSTNAIVRNNIIWATTGFALNLSGGGTIASNNLCPSAGTGCSVTSDPRFVSPANGDFRLCTGKGTRAANCTGASPALNQAVAISNPSPNPNNINYAVDILGTVRPQGPGWDIGAYEMNTGVQLSPNNP
jgi:hypothetical protein